MIWWNSTKHVKANIDAGKAMRLFSAAWKHHNNRVKYIRRIKRMAGYRRIK